MERDALHDYRPDPQIPGIKSHLEKWEGQDETELNQLIPELARKAYGFLTGFNEWFMWEHGNQKGEEIHPPSFIDAHPDQKAAWDGRDAAGKCDWIRTLTLTEILKELKPELREHEFNKPIAGTPSQPVNGTQPQYALRPYLFRLLELADFDWKGRLIPILLKDSKKTFSGLGLTEDEAKNAGIGIMVGMLNFRMSYMWELIMWLKNGGPDAQNPRKRPLHFNAKAVGSADMTSDIDITFGGPDDVPAMFETNRYFRSGWGKRELGTTFDTMIYLRDWMTTQDNINVENKKKSLDEAPDPSIQVEVLEYIGDLYGLVKIRRFCAKEQWDTLCKAIKRDVAVDGLAVDEIPLFKRLDLVNQIYQTHYVKPLISRVRTKDGLNKIMKHKLLQIDNDDDLLEALWHFYPDETLRAANLAYVELAAKVRDNQRNIFLTPEYQAPDGEAFVWRQNKGPNLEDKKAEMEVEIDGNKKTVGLNLTGMIALLEQQSLLVSEMILFATEAYWTQGSLWQVVGGQGGARPDNLTLEHYLQCFNEQIGDALKELHEHLREVELGKMMEKESGEDTDGHELLEREFQIGSYRASKYEQRMREVLEGIVKQLKPEENPVLKRRLEVYRKLFPGRISPDEEDSALLRFELSVSKFYDEHIGELLNIRKLRGKYANMTEEDKRESAKDLILKATSKDSEFTHLSRDPARDIGRLQFPGNSRFNPEVDKDYGDLAWGMRELMHHLLTHCAIVNKCLRKIFSRGPYDLFVRNFSQSAVG